VQLLERVSQLGALAEYAREADGGQGRLVLLSGEAGVGKSSLVEQFETDLSDAEWFWGACDGLFTPRPLAPLHDLAGRLGGEVAALGRADAPREQLFAALLSRISAPDILTVCVVEDIHWADEASLDLLRYIGRRIRDVRALLVVTYRDEGVAASDPLRVALGELATQRTTRRLSLPSLSAEAVGVLLDGTDLEPDEVYRLTGGNPFYLTEILRHGVGELPSSARDAVLAHLAGRSEEARQVIDVAALIGARVEPALLQSITAADPSVVDEVLASGVVVSDGERLRFRHEIARLAVEQSIGAHRRAPIHRSILDGLIASGCDDDARLAFHAEGAGDAEMVLTHAPLAAHRASALAAHREAAAQYQRALRFVAGVDPTVAAGLYDALGEECSIIDRWYDVLDACQEALALWRQVGDRLREGATLGLYARALWRLCRGREAHLAIEEALHVLEPIGPSTELAWAVASLASTRGEEFRSAEAIELAARTRAMAEELGLTELLSDSLNTEGWARSGLDGDWETPLLESLDIALADGWYVAAGRSYINLYVLYRLSLRFAEGERYYREGIAYCDEHDVSTFGACLRGEYASALVQQGRWPEAMRLAERQLARTGASLINRMNPLITQGVVRARRGEAGVWESLDEAVASADGVDEPVYIVQARLARAEAHWLEGDLDEAMRDVELAEAAAVALPPMMRSETAGWRHRIAGDVPPGRPLLGPYAVQVAGDGARAAQMWDELGCPYEAALALVDAGEEPQLREALTRLERLGATATVAVVRQRMRRLGIRSVPTGARKATRDDPAGLTRREREVLELICEGSTNEQISDRLYISVKTVDHHVSAVLGKLGVGSRRVAATEAVRRGLVGAQR
jgi:DNA-binding CsgD family transcriptional regulator/tetratricopeptide (TPR) repeat protein